MQSEHLQGDANNPEPFIIWKNARKEIKKQQKRRKQSYQYPVTAKKQRKMTIEVSRPSSELEDLPSFKSFQSDRAIEEEQDQLQHHDFIDNISEGEENHHNEDRDDARKQENEEVDERKNSYDQQYEQQHEVEEKLPFNCNQWELDKQTPYLKNSNLMQEQMDELRIDT